MADQIDANIKAADKFVSKEVEARADELAAQMRKAQSDE